MKIKRTLIACNIFQAEMEHILSRNLYYEVETIWIRAGLHGDLNLLEKSVKEALAAAAGAEPGPRLMLGAGCLPQLPELLKGRDIPALPAKNCLGALVGEERLLELEKDRTMVITPAWLEMWFAEDGLRALFGWDDTDFRLNFGRYDRILILDAGLCPLTDEEILGAFEIIQVPIESAPFSLDHFEKVLLNFLA
jgi:hypothetical protein